jgi:hypothetical protein
LAPDSTIGGIARPGMDAAAPSADGESRLRIVDRGFWAATVEFQPSARSKGAYLNVGVTWLWRPRGSWSFDWIEPGRQTPWARFDSPAQYEAVRRRFSERADAEVAGLSRRFASMAGVAEALTLRAADERSIWSAYHAGIACGLRGDKAAARAFFSQIASHVRPDVGWTRELLLLAQTLYARLEEPARFQSTVIALIGHTRGRLRLPPEWPKTSVVAANGGLDGP